MAKIYKLRRTSTLALRHRKDVVELSLSTAFVTHWLVPRLPLFHEAFPSVDLRFQLISSNLRGGPGTVDLAMRMKSEHDADYLSWHFAPELIIPVCSPSYLAQPGDLLADTMCPIRIFAESSSTR